jgi:hypothetical protein
VLPYLNKEGFGGGFIKKATEKKLKCILVNLLLGRFIFTESIGF